MACRCHISRLFSLYNFYYLLKIITASRLHVECRSIIDVCWLSCELSVCQLVTVCVQVSVIGGIPVMLKTTDMSNTIPDEKTVVTYVSYLCARLLSVRNEQHAAAVIQSAWRRYRAHRLAVSSWTSCSSVLSIVLIVAVR